MTARTRDREVEFQLLGQLRVRSDGRYLDLGSPKQRSVLAVLLLHANEVVPTDRIIDLVWGEQAPRTADHSVQIYISELRKALSNGASGSSIETRLPGYVINIPPDSVDAARFERLVRDGISAVRSGDSVRGSSKLEEAVETWKGEPLSDFAYDDFAQGYIRSLSELYTDALQALAEVEFDQGNNDRAREFARSAIGVDPLRETPRRVMILALYRSGRQAEALRRYGEYQGLLAEELGIEPSEQMRDLEERILLQDPTLDITPSAGADGNPYRSLRAFSEDDADVYFGRESLVSEVLERLADGPGFVSIVGPSGSGKSSAARAGVTPALRANGETVVVFQPGSRPLWELAGALDMAGFGSRAALLRRFETDSSSLIDVVTRPVVLIVDQFEEVFTLAHDEDSAIRFSELIAHGIRDEATPLRVVATLRADYYDRPLSVPVLAGVFSESVVSVKPMTPQELERAVVEPARVSGRHVEPALLAQLVADMGDEPGALPLLQFALFELFERSQNVLTLADYDSIGGIKGALTGGADQLLGDLHPEGRALVEQLMMRMIQSGQTINTARPVSLRDLVDLGVDRVELQSVLEAFGSRRLITFDRDSTGAATVEIAHEYLIGAWHQMQLWIEAHSEDLDRLRELETAAAEWTGADRSADYLLRGDRLERFENWLKSTSLRLTRTEAGLIASSVDLRERESRERLERAETEESLRQSARRRLWAFGGAVAALAAAVTWLVIALIPEPPPDLILWSEGAENGFGRQIADGVDVVTEELGLTSARFADSATYLGDIEAMIESGTPLVVLQPNFFIEGEVLELQALMERHPDTGFIFIDCDARLSAAVEPIANVSCIVTRHDEIGFLAGLVAARMTATDHVGIVVGVDSPKMHGFHTGFEDGVAYVDPAVQVSSVYLTNEFDRSGFTSPTLAFVTAGELIAEGADVIFSAAGDSYYGVLETALVSSRECCMESFLGRASESAASSDRKVWTVAVDEDWYQRLTSEETTPAQTGLYRDHIATSIVKRLEVGVAGTIRRFFEAGTLDTFYLDIANGGVDYVTTGGFIDDHLAALEEAKEAIMAGTVELTSEPPDEIRYASEVLQR